MVAALSAALSAASERRSPFAAGAAPTYLFLIAGIAAMPLALAKVGLEIALLEFGMLGCILVFGSWTAWCLRGRGWARLATALEAWTLFHAVNVILALMTFVAGTSPRAFFDAPLAQADRMLLPALDWPAAMVAFSGSGLPVRLANVVYESLLWQPTLLIVTLVLTSASYRVWHFMLAWIITLAIVIAVFALYPALGAYQYFALAADDVPGMLDPIPWTQPGLLHDLRNGTLGTLSLGKLTGIINFPSFHAGAAVLLAYGHWANRVLRWPFVALNALMLAASAPIGGHYIVDLLAGAVVAFIGIAAAKRIIDGRTSEHFQRRVGPATQVIRPHRSGRGSEGAVGSTSPSADQQFPG